MTKKNYEIRFKTSGETYNLVAELWNQGFFDLKKTSFFEKVFLLGLNQIKLQLQKGRDKQKTDLKDFKK